MDISDSGLKYREQHKQRLNYMPWLYWQLKPAQKTWALQWQSEWQSYLCEMETVDIQGECFISPEAKLFAERGRPIVIREGSFIAADAVIHGPVDIGKNVGINHHVCVDGGKKGVRIGNDCRIAAHCSIYAFNHGVDAARKIDDQNVNSKGITIGEDVWLGAYAGVVDGVSIGKGAVVGMRSVVTKDVEEYSVVAGSPARFIKFRN